MMTERACPVCENGIEMDREAKSCRCKNCGHGFKTLDNGTTTLLVDNANDEDLIAAAIQLRKDWSVKSFWKNKEQVEAREVELLLHSCSFHPLPSTRTLVDSTLMELRMRVNLVASRVRTNPNWLNE